MAGRSLSKNVLTMPQLPDYVITDKIGAGSYATVYKAFRKTGPREVVAVKCVSKLSLNNITKENLLTEIELLKTLKHEHIVLLKDFSWDENYIYLVMEYCSGGDLASLIHNHRMLSEKVVRRFLQQLAAALQYMRTKHVSHMDLKPSNILLSSTHNPQLKIGDFGFAHYLIGDTNADHLRGSLLYMAPEIIIHRQYNEKADLWSVGVILYECLFGNAPFASRTMEVLEIKILETVPINIPAGVNISDKCRDLVTRLLQRDPDIRIGYEEFFSHPFIDLDHRPCPEALQKATALVTRAVACDVAGRDAEAIGLYGDSLAYFIPAIHYETDSRRRQLLREKVNEYFMRAEELQQRLKPTKLPPSSDQSTVSQDKTIADGEDKPSTTVRRSRQPLDELEQLASDSPDMAAALRLVRLAELAETFEEYKLAFDRYEQSFSVLIKLLQNEPAGRRKELLQASMSRWMSRAEAIKKYLAVQDDVRAKHLNMAASKNDADEDDYASSSITSLCVLQ